MVVVSIVGIIESATISRCSVDSIIVIVIIVVVAVIIIVVVAAIVENIIPGLLILSIIGRRDCG